MTEEATVAASVSQVWRDFTDASALTEWIWPPRLETTAVVDPRPQGVWEIRSEVGELAVLGTVLAVDPPRSLRLAWRWDGEQHSTDAEIALERIADATTLVTVRHSGFETPEERDLHVEGWSNCLGRLVERYARWRRSIDTQQREVEDAATVTPWSPGRCSGMQRPSGMRFAMSKSRLLGSAALAGVLVVAGISVGPAFAEDPPPLVWSTVSGFPITEDGVTSAGRRPLL